MYYHILSGSKVSFIILLGWQLLKKVYFRYSILSNPLPQISPHMKDGQGVNFSIKLGWEIWLMKFSKSNWCKETL